MPADAGGPPKQESRGGPPCEAGELGGHATHPAATFFFSPPEAMPRKKGTGRKVKGGGKTRTNRDHRMACKRGIVKGRWDDIVAAELNPEATIGGRAQAVVVKEKTALDPDKPGLGQFYCVACCRYLISQHALDDHCRQSKHKRRLKMLLTETPYSHAEANAGAGRGATDHGLTRDPRDGEVQMDDAASNV